MTTISEITLKRLKQEKKDLEKNKCDFMQAIQDETNPLIFYFLLKGDNNSSFAGGYYMGKVILPQRYPHEPCDIMLLTPNGRFEIDRKICLTNTGFHPDEWNPTWTINRILIGLNSVWTEEDNKSLGHIIMSNNSRREMASNSIEYNINKYRNIFTKFDRFVNQDGTIKSHVTTTEPTKELLTDVSKELLTDHPKEPLTDHPKEPLTDHPKEPLSDHPKEPLTDMPKEPLTDVPKEQTKDAPKDATKDTPKDTPKDATKDTPKDATKDATKDAPKDTPKDAPKELKDTKKQSITKTRLKK